MEPDWKFFSAETRPEVGSGFSVAANADNTVTPGFFDVAAAVSDGRSLATLRDVSIYRILPRRVLRTLGVPSDVIAAEFPEIASYNVSELRSSDALAHIAELIRRFVRHYTVRVQQASRIVTFIALSELHCPSRNGAVATLRMSGTVSKGEGFELKLFGFGGGGGTITTIRLGSSLQARDGRCYRIMIAAEFLVEACTLRSSLTGTRSNFTRVTPLGCAAGLRQEPVQPICHHCNRPNESWSADVVVSRYDFSSVTRDEIATIALEVERDRRANAKLSLPISALSTSVEVMGEVAARRGLTYEYSLPGGAAYCAYRPTAHPFYYWRVE